MKEAIWKTMPLGDYRFVGGQGQQMILNDLVGFRPEAMSKMLIQKFGRQIWVPYAKIKTYISSDCTPFCTSQIKEALRFMEKNDLLEVENRQRRQTYPPECKIRFSGATLFSR